MPKILIIDDEEGIRLTLSEILQYEDYETETAKDGKEGLEMVKKGDYDVVLCDVKMPKMDGLEVLEKAMEFKPETQFIMISGHGDIETAVDAAKKGAFDFLSKPPDLNRLLITVRNAMDKTSLVTETKKLKRKVTGMRDIIGESSVITKIKETIERVAPTEARVLVTGSNGTGKELVARWVHAKSKRNKGPIVEVNCAAIPSELIESELFGHEKGSFTGASKQRIGKFEQANGGTLFLDEIGDMSLSAQAKVLRALQESKITRIGSDKQIKVDVRIVAATNKDLLAEIEKGSFREDLYHRLSVILIHVPPLKDRADDIPLLVDSFMEDSAEENGVAPLKFTPDAMKALQSLAWTGNIRELRNVVERLVILCDHEINEEDINNFVVPRSRTAKSDSIYDRFEKFQDYKEYAEKEFLLHKLRDQSWNITKTAEAIDIQRSHLYSKMEKYNIKRDE